MYENSLEKKRYPWNLTIIQIQYKQLETLIVYIKKSFILKVKSITYVIFVTIKWVNITSR